MHTRSSPPSPCAGNPSMRSRTCALACVIALSTDCAGAAQFVINGPPGSDRFGATVNVLPNGNIVVTDQYFDAPGPPAVADVGAVYLYRPDGTLISTLIGSSPGDRIGGFHGMVVLTNGNFVVSSPNWNNGSIADAGAVTFGSRDKGVSGTVSPANSLVGTSAGDRVGNAGIAALANGNYVVASEEWDNSEIATGYVGTPGSGTRGIGGPVLDAGAVTFGSGTTGISGPVSSANSLVGTSPTDRVGNFGILALANGNYVVCSPNWNNGAIRNAGAVTFGSGTVGISGPVSPANSLVGSTAGDEVGYAGGLTALFNGNYVVSSPFWDNGAISDAGAVTFAPGTTGISGPVSAASSLVGSTAGDQLGDLSTVTALSNGNYVVSSPRWDNGAIVDAGAVTFGKGSVGISGPVSPANSLVGTSEGDKVGFPGATALANGNYVVASLFWDTGAAIDVGAVTFGSGDIGIVGPVSPANSLVGSTTGDRVGDPATGSDVTALSNGNYVVVSPYWDNGAIVDAGAVTFGSGTAGVIGPVSPANSLVGSTAYDQLGFVGSVAALSDGDYVVGSPYWDNGAIVDAGAATFGSGTVGINGPVSPANSLVGSAASDLVGLRGATALSNGNYVVRSPFWDNGAEVNAGAATFGSGTMGIIGPVSPANSLVGSNAEDFVGNASVTALSGGNYVVNSPNWNSGGILDAGAVTFGSGGIGVSGSVSSENSLVGSTELDRVGYDDFAFRGVTALPNGNYVVRSGFWDNGAIVNAGAVTLGFASIGVAGPITAAHGVLGLASGGGWDQRFGHDALRNQLAVGDPRSNRVVLQRIGVATSISIVGDSPDPSSVGEQVTFTARVSAPSSTPSDGHVRFVASTGESCIDDTATPVSATAADYSCTIAFDSVGTSNVVAEFIGSILHAYSSSAPRAHTTAVESMFADGFESS
jgi:hypothetical protein